jgi:hypothetical protein
MVIIQVRDFAPIGLRPVGSTPRREWWNAGILEKWVLAYGSEMILQYWVNGKIHLDAKV